MSLASRESQKSYELRESGESRESQDENAVVKPNRYVTRAFPAIVSFPNACLWLSTLVYVAKLWAKNNDAATPSAVVGTTDTVLVFAGLNFLLWVLLQKDSLWKILN